MLKRMGKSHLMYIFECPTSRSTCPPKATMKLTYSRHLQISSIFILFARPWAFPGSTSSPTETSRDLQDNTIGTSKNTSPLSWSQDISHAKIRIDSRHSGQSSILLKRAGILVDDPAEGGENDGSSNLMVAEDSPSGRRWTRPPPSNSVPTFDITSPPNIALRNGRSRSAPVRALGSSDTAFGSQQHHSAPPGAGAYQLKDVDQVRKASPKIKTAVYAATLHLG